MEGGLFVGGNSGCCWFDLNTHIEAYNSVAFNNVIVSDGGAASPLLLGMVGAQDSALVNNVVIDGSMFFERGAAEGYDPRPPSINPIIQNNISSCGGRFVMSLDLASISTISAIDYNNFFECTSIPIQNHPVVGDPLFINRRSDWHLKSGSPALRSGSKLFFRAFLA